MRSTAASRWGRAPQHEGGRGAQRALESLETPPASGTPHAHQPPKPPRRASAAALTFAALLALIFGSSRAAAAPEAHILRIDPRASTVDGAPVLTTVVEVVQNKRMSDVTRSCMALSGDANLDCVANALDAPGALYSSFDFPDKNALLTVTVDGQDTLARFESKARWGESAGQPGVGTAWLILVDAASSMGGRFDEAKAVASAFVNAMGPQDIVDVVFFNDRGVVDDTKWTNSKQAAAQAIANGHTYATQGRTRPLFNIIKNAATDSFKELGNAGQGVVVPMHQAMVVLSNGSAGADPSSNAAASNLLKDYLTKGRFPENNEVLPKTPVPIISIWFPSKLIEEFGANAREFMEGLANNEIGGFFTVLRDGQQGRAANIVSSIRTRFSKMHIVKWRVSCVAPTITQTFKLVFQNTTPPIAGDATFQNVPVGLDPTTWPLDIDREATEREAKKNPIYPGGTLRVYGNFCWGGNASRAELYMLPKNQAVPASLQGGTIDDAKRAQRTLIEAGMKGKASSAGDSMVEFDLPSSEKWLAGKGESMTGRLIVYDNQAHRTSPATADKILTLRAREAPLPFMLIGGITFGGVVVVLLIVSIARGGGGGAAKRRGGAAAPPPRPVVAGGPMPPGPAPYPPQPGTVPADPMMFAGGGAPYGAATRATLTGQADIFTVSPGLEMRAGRDRPACQILLNEPRVSGTHATLRFEGGQLLVRDENSNNGTWINGQRIPAGVFTPVPAGAALRFGPIEFAVRLE